MMMMIVQAELTGRPSDMDERENCDHEAELCNNLVFTYRVPNWSNSKGTASSVKESRATHFGLIGEDLANRIPALRNDAGAGEMIADWLNRHWGGNACLTLSKDLMLVAFDGDVTHEKATAKKITKTEFEIEDVLNERKVDYLDVSDLSEDDSEPASKPARKRKRGGRYRYGSKPSKPA